MPLLSPYSLSDKNTLLTFADGTSYNPGTVEFSNTITGMATSLMWNFSSSGGGFDFDYMNSPAPGTPGYEGNMIYEFSVNTASFGGDLGVLIADSHHSPSKLESESFTPPPSENFTPSPVPEPATILLFGASLAGLAVGARRKK